jgi:hypothetical protein
MSLVNRRAHAGHRDQFVEIPECLMSGSGLTLHYHKGTHWNIPVHRARFVVSARRNADFAVYGDQCLIS